MKKKNSKLKIVLIVIAVLIAVGIIGNIANGNNNSNATTSDKAITKAPEVTNAADDIAKENTPTAKPTQATKDLSNIKTTYTITAGNYTAGIDLPVGKCDLTAISGNGNVSSSNLYAGGVNEMMGTDTSDDLYSKEFKGLSMDKDVVLNISSGLKLKLEYTDIKDGFTPRKFDKEKSITLSNGNYEVNTDIPAGIYNLSAVSGNGNISSSNLYNGGINEMMGTDKDMYIQTYKNLILNDGDTLEISNGVKIKFVPAK